MAWVQLQKTLQMSKRSNNQRPLLGTLLEAVLIPEMSNSKGVK